MQSLERHLLVWISGALSLGALLLAVVAYAVVFDEMDEVFDENLRQVALAVAEHAPRDAGSTAELRLPTLPHGYEEGDDFELAIAAFDRHGRLIHGSGPSARLPFLQFTGISEVTVDGQPWHVYAVVLPDQVVEVAERASSHRHLATRTAAELAWPLLLMVPVVALLLGLALRHGLRPLDRAAAGVAARSAQSLAPIAAGDVPREIRPLIGAINALIERLSGSMDAQRRFVADAAHELRTPITALRLQMDVLASSTEAGERASLLSELALGIARAQHLVEQLLDLSRVEPEGGRIALEALDLGERSRKALERHADAAARKDMALSFEPIGKTTIAADRFQIDTLLDNLIGNAIRHGQAGGSVEVIVSALPPCVLLRIVDDGPGIPPDERARVFDRFYRIARLEAEDAAIGSGLGLSIVKVVADRHGADVALTTPAAGRGLEVRVAFPLPVRT